MSEQALDTSTQQAALEQPASELRHDAAGTLKPKEASVTDLVAWIFDAATSGVRQRSRDNMSLDVNVGNSKSQSSSESSEGSESESSESSFASSSSSSDSSEPEKPALPLKSAIDAIKELIEEDKTDSDQKHLRSRNEVDPGTIKLPRPNIIVSADDEIYPVGKIMSVLESVVIVSTGKDCLLDQNSEAPQAPANRISFSQATNLNLVSALDHDSVLCFENRQLFGLIDETFGPVDNPFYVVRFNNEEERDSAGAAKGRTVFAVKHKSKWVKGSELQTKGYDTSNWNDEEVTATDDFSDDEDERAAKQAEKRAKKREAEPAAAGFTKRRRFGQPNVTGEVRGNPSRHHKGLQNGRVDGRNFAARQAGEPNHRSQPQHMYDPMTPSMWPGTSSTPRAAYHQEQLRPANSVHGQGSEELLTPTSFKGTAGGIPPPFYGFGVQVPGQFNNQIPPGVSSNLHGPQRFRSLYPADVAGNPNRPRHAGFFPPGSLHPPIAPGSVDRSTMGGPATDFHAVNHSGTMAGLGGPGNPISQHQYSYHNPSHMYPSPPMFTAPDGSPGRRPYSGSYYPGVSNMYSNNAYGGHQSRMSEARPAHMAGYRSGVEQARYPEPHQGGGHTTRPPARSYPPGTGGQG
ncbi:H/ACA ribonucleoprotein complex non-core subunit NAF1 [Gracilariopsis chorda]|uniref:H/ACA ribonucleoprotein complex non-core subunit NAF1 n=1 Tax=Gracilariopsis chorda TaxID=448386 RepID=A0A2V3IXH5_9FLOR|nr:H/ACA ribonucleoprotein complex non-core subunit NAF1 [Gracilariopsis chorda]|eukprot:PXF46765.1 H/ACA ribonucleoprotein complex non-core subunit NAF1 [Gracilariopsis chorda]